MAIAPLIKSLKKNEEGIWTSILKDTINYPENGNAFCFGLEEKSYWFRHRNDCIITMLQMFSPSGTILDIGGGNGFVSQRIQKEGFQVTLLEPGEVGARNAKNFRGINEVINASFQAVEFPHESLSAVGLFDVLEHIENDNTFLSNVLDALKPGGYIYLTLPASNWLWSHSDLYAEHFRRYNLDMMSSLTSNSFSIVYFSYYFSALLFPTILMRALPYRFGIKKRGILSSDKEFGIGGGFSINLLSQMLRLEQKILQSGKTLPFGTSCLCVLEKTNVQNPI